MVGCVGLVIVYYLLWRLVGLGLDLGICVSESGGVWGLGLYALLVSLGYCGVGCLVGWL